ncbi:MAG: hypothetical protein AMXMBFR53_33350 [Gemmatimonadota bacterium]
MQPPDQQARRDDRAYSDLVSDVLTDVDKREAAARAAAGPRNPRLRVWGAAALALVFAGLVGMNFWLLTRPPEGLPPAAQEVDLRYIVAGVADVVEDFREANGRLPTPGEMEDYLADDDEVRYEVSGEHFRVTAQAEGVEVTYDGSVPLAEWLSIRTHDSVTARGAP